jgi:hypothetical protein
VKENMGALTPTKFDGQFLVSKVGKFMSEVSAPTMDLVAASMKSTPIVFDTNGKD